MLSFTASVANPFVLVVSDQIIRKPAVFSTISENLGGFFFLFFVCIYLFLTFLIFILFLSLWKSHVYPIFQIVFQKAAVPSKLNWWI